MPLAADLPIVGQLATGLTLADWRRPYVLELSYTSWRLTPYAQELGDDSPPFRGDAERRAPLRADLDAAFLHVFRLTRVEAEHLLASLTTLLKTQGLSCCCSHFTSQIRDRWIAPRMD
jgi:hypothetical protein